MTKKEKQKRFYIKKLEKNKDTILVTKNNIDNFVKKRYKNFS